MKTLSIFKRKKTKIGKFFDKIEEMFEWLMHIILEFADVMPWPF